VVLKLKTKPYAISARCGSRAGACGHLFRTPGADAAKREEEDIVNPKKLKEKDRRRARKLAEEAWQAVDDDNLDLAEKIIRRAVAAQEDNPVLWNDQGVILGLRRKDAEGGESFRTALSLAPTYAEPFNHLAALFARQGFVSQAVNLQAEAIKHAPDNAVYAERLEAYRALAGTVNDPSVAAATVASADSKSELPAIAPAGDWSNRLAELDWAAFSDRLTCDGYVRIESLVDAATCSRLRGMYDDDGLFAKTVVMDRPEFGLGEYRYFRAPIPFEIDSLRRGFFPNVSRIANKWRRLLGEPETFSDNWEEFRDECRRAGQTTPTPILLKYRAGGFNALHRDLRGAVFFPIQMVVVLSPRVDSFDAPADGFRGGEFLFCDVPVAKKSRRRTVAAGLGDVVLFCTRDRLVPIGGAYGLQPVKHGVTPITAGIRYVLGVPFHEYR
jgi:uncharacterized protein